MYKLLYVILFSALFFVPCAVFSQSETNKDVITFVEAHGGKTLFTSREIVRFDWERQMMEITPSAAAILSTTVKDNTEQFAVKDKDGVIYRGRIIFEKPNPDAYFDGPILVYDKSGDGSFPAIPYLTILGGYGDIPDGAQKDTLHISERVKSVLEADGLIDDIHDFELPLVAVSSETLFIDKDKTQQAKFLLYPNSYRAGSIGYVMFETKVVAEEDDKEGIEAKSVLSNGEYDNIKMYMRLSDENYTSPVYLLAVIYRPFQINVDYVCIFDIKRGEVRPYSDDHFYAFIEKFYRPAYPKDAINENRGGVVTAEVVIYLDGTVKEFTILENSSNHDDIKNAAERAVSKIEFAPPSKIEKAIVEIVFADGEITNELILDGTRPKSAELDSGHYKVELTIQLIKGEGASAVEVGKIPLNAFYIDIP